MTTSSGGCQAAAGREKSRKAFTLVELLIVVGILVLLMGLLLPSVREAKMAATETRDLNHVRQVMIACQNYALCYNTWPAGSTAGDGNLEPLKEELKNYIKKDDEVYKDAWYLQPLVYVNSKYYDVGSISLAGPPIEGNYNPKNFQLFSLGRDGKSARQGNGEENEDNMWADILNNRVVLFAEIRDRRGL